MNKYLEIILKEMANRVGADYEQLDVKSTVWYMKYEWTVEQQDRFKEWLVNYLYTNTQARKAIVNNPMRTKTHLRKVADEFIFQYGWKLNA